MRPLHGDGGRVQASNAGGTEPVWDRRGSTLYYVEDYGEELRLVAAVISGSPRLAVAKREVAVPHLRLEQAGNHPNYDVDPSGTRFVIPAPEASRGLVAVFDWAASLRR